MLIRHAKKTDVKALAQIEALSYPKLEGASEESISKRVEAFPECFWILEEDGIVKAFINGLRSNEINLRDEMYEYAQMHEPKGEWQMIFSVVTHLEYRGKGYAAKLLKQMIEDSKKRGLKGIVLTCKENLLGFYGQYGFVNEGVSASVHGNVQWYQMRLVF